MRSLLLFIGLLSLLSIATVAADVWCCTDGCFSGTNENDLTARCNGTVVTGACGDELACQIPGCCCDAGEYTSYAACVEDAGSFYPDVTDSECAEFCEDPTTPDGTCDLDTFDVRIRNTLGVPSLTIDWTVCDGIENVLIERQGAASPVATFTGTGPGTWTDDTTQWDRPYRYFVTIRIDGEEHEFDLSRNTGDQACEGVSSTRTCVGNEIQVCTLNNQDQGRQTCVGGCTTINGVAQCEGAPDVCQLQYPYLSVAHPTMCEVQGLYEGVSCYYDRSSIGIDGCYDCNSVTHCYDFKTDYACGRAETVCPQFEGAGCTWEPFDDLGFGEGYCRPKEASEANMCSFLISPAGRTQTDLYSPLLTPIQHEKSIGWFSIGEFQCTAFGASCGSAFSEESCRNVVPSADYSCEWRGSYCAKHTFENEYFPEDYRNDYLCEDDPSSVCERLITPPSISLAHEVDFGARTVTFIATVRDGDGRIVADLSEYRFSTCTGSCTRSFDFVDSEDNQPDDGRFTYSFSEFGITDTSGAVARFSASVRDPGFNVAQTASRSVTIDPTLPNPTLTIKPVQRNPSDPSMGDYNDRIELTANWNRGSDARVTIEGMSEAIELTSPGTTEYRRIDGGSFNYEDLYNARLTVILGSQPYHSDDVEFSLTRPAFFFTIEEPTSSFIPEDGRFSIRVTTSEAADSCSYAITDSENPPNTYQTTLEGSGTTWTRAVTRAEDGWLHIRCVSGARDYSRSMQLTYVPGPEPPQIIRIEVLPGETLVFPDANGQFVATFTVHTNVKSVCRFTDRDWTTTPSMETTLERSFSQSRDVTIVCRDLRESEPRTISITIDPAATWFGFLKPTGTLRAALIPYRIGTGASGLYAVCSIPEIEATGLAGQDIKGEFDPTTFDWYDGDGTYELTATCVGYQDESRTGETTVPETITTEFTIDNTPPTLSVRINDESERIEITEAPLPTNTYVRFQYSDASPIQTLSYQIRATNGSGWTTIREDTLTDLGTSGSQQTSFGFTLQDQTEYRVSARIVDAAGNAREANSSRLIINLPDPCHTGDICGGDCGATCDIGDVCTTNADCAGGDQVICTDAGFCDYAHCYNNRMDEDKGETGVDCGGVCGACTITLVEPSFGVSATRETRVVINTTEAMQCTWSDGDRSFPFDSVSSTQRTHTINRIDVINTPLINVSCSNDRVNEWNTFALSHDPRRPEIVFQANPDIEGRKSITSEGSVYATTFTARSTNDVPIICRVSETNRPYSQMTEFLGKDYQTDRDESAYRNVQNEQFGFKEPGVYRLYVDCLAKNGLTSGVTSATFTADPDGKPTPRIVVPSADRIYSEESIKAVVDARSIQAQACFDQLESFDVREMSLAQGTVYERDLNLIEGERLRYTGMCEYVISGLNTNASTSLRFTVDRTPPEIESVTIRDPNTQNTSTLTTRNGVEIIVVARDEITHIARYEYEIRVNGQLVSEGLRMRNRFIDNELNLSEGDRVQARITVTDAAGNAASQDSNQLTYTVVPPPDICEEQGLCGGECPPCEEIGDVCEIDTDCGKGLYCLDGECADRETICTNDRFDPDYETAKDCGGICDPCEEGASCTTHADCGENQYCASDRTCKTDYQAICSNDEHDPKYESGVDCGGVCEELFGQACEVGDACNTNADCAGTAICKGGVCTAEYTPPTNAWCSEDRFNNTLEDGSYCGQGCNDLCTEGVGCRLTSDCASGLVCEAGVCIEEKKEETDTCLFPTDSNPPPCGGDCEPCGLQRMCKTDSDCRSGVCTSGHCAASDVDDRPITQPTPRGGLDEACRVGGECDDGLSCNDENICVRAPSIWRWIIFILLFVLLGVAGYIAYRYYYLPNQKPDYQEEQFMGAETANAAFDEHTTAESSVNPPSGPPVMSDKQHHVSELIREKRAAKKKEEREELFSAFDESALDSEPAQPEDVPKTKLETTKDEEKPIVGTRKKSRDSFKEILDEAKDEHE